MTGPTVPAVLDVYLPETDPGVVVTRARQRAKVLMDVVRARKLAVRIGGQEYLRFEAWQVLGAMYGITPVVVSVEEQRDDHGRLVRAKARAEARWRGQVVLSAAESECSRDEVLVTRSGERRQRWADAADAQIKGMAQTRACARALRHALAWVAVLAGYEPTPAEELEQLDLMGGGEAHGTEVGHRP